MSHCQMGMEAEFQERSVTLVEEILAGKPKPSQWLSVLIRGALTESVKAVL